MGDREADPLGDRRRVAAAVFVEHPDRHQPGPVGEAGERDPVAGLLGDRPGDVGAVAVFVERHAVPADEVIAVDELPGAEVGAAQEGAPQRAVGDPGIEHGDGDAFSAGPPDFFQMAPGVDRVDAAGRDRQAAAGQAFGGEEVPLLEGPAADRGRRFRRASEGAGVIGDDEGRAARRGGGDVVGLRVFDARVAAQGGGALAHADAGGEPQLLSVAVAVELDDQLVGGEAVRLGQAGPGSRRGGGKRDGGGREGESRKESSHGRGARRYRCIRASSNS